MKKTAIAVIGGDGRQRFAAEELRRLRYTVTLSGRGEESPSWREAAGGRILLLPVPCTRDGKTLWAPQSRRPIPLAELSACLRPDALVIGGGLGALFGTVEKGEDLLLREDFQWQNAVPTAEAAIALALRESGRTVRWSRCMVIGGGRIGQVLSELLKAMGAQVCVTSRRETDLARTAAAGLEAWPTGELWQIAERFDVIFNTVPAPVLDHKALEHVSPHCLILDLASAPGGVDRTAAEELHRRAVFAPGLPGRVTPVTAGIIVARTVDRIIHTTNGRKNDHGQ